jgi:zinc D-Ala-D-Ala carboxypeptidase
MLCAVVFLQLSCGEAVATQQNIVPTPTTDAIPVTTPPAPMSVTKPAETTTTHSASQHTYTPADLLGKFVPAQHPGFARVAAAYTSKSDMYLRKEVYAAFVEMHKAAKADGIKINIISSTRPFAHQKGIWDRKWTALNGKKLTNAEKAKHIMLYSAMPGCSRHHWGTDMDLNSLENGDFATGAVHGKVYQWLTEHASAYGFCQVYSARSTGRATGYEEERWHWSYMPTAGPMLAVYEAQITYADLSGFEGAASAEDLQVIENYVKGIAETCKER